METQNQIQKNAKNLKESTKKLCRLFKENPNLEGDAIKVKNDRADLVIQLEKLIESIYKQDTYKTQASIIQELQA